MAKPSNVWKNAYSVLGGADEEENEDFGRAILRSFKDYEMAHLTSEEAKPDDVGDMMEVVHGFPDKFSREERIEVGQWAHRLLRNVPWGVKLELKPRHLPVGVEDKDISTLAKITIIAN